MKIIVHAGMHKTGTSSIQDAYAAEKIEGLSYFPWLGPNHTGLFITLFEKESQLQEFHGFKMQQRSNQYMLDLRSEWSKKTLDFLKESKDDTFLFSAEAISGQNEHAVHSFSVFCKDNFDEIKVILYVRPPRSYMASSFQELIKANTVRRFNVHDFWPHYRDKISIIEEHFGSENLILRKFDPSGFPNRSIIDDFARTARIPLPKNRSTTSNVSLSLEGVAALYLQRRLGDGLVLGAPDLFSKNAKFVQALDALGTSKFIFSNDVLEEAKRQFPGDLEWISERMGEELIDEQIESNSKVISSERDLIDVALSLKEEILDCVISRLRSEDFSSASGLARGLSMLRKSFY